MTRKTTLGNAEAQKLRTLQSDIEALPDPSTLWTWSDGLGAVGPSALEQLKDIDAVEKITPGRGGWWRVSPRVAEWIQRVHDVRPSGDVGQDTLPTCRIVPEVDVRESSSSRTLGRQVTLNGEPVTRSGDVEMDVHDEDDSLEPSVPPQMHLDDIDDWLTEDPDARFTVSFGLAPAA